MMKMRKNLQLAQFWKKRESSLVDVTNVVPLEDSVKWINIYLCWTETHWAVQRNRIHEKSLYSESTQHVHDDEYKQFQKVNHIWPLSRESFLHIISEIIIK